MTAKELIELINRTCKPDDEVAAILWGANDVRERAVELDIECSQEEANEITRHISNKADCEMGITWDTIDGELTSLDNKRSVVK